MTTTAADIMRSVSKTLLDETYNRWPLPELASWIDEAIQTICYLRPDASSRSVILQLQAGSLQKLPAQTADNSEQIISLKKISYNIENIKRPEDGGKIITVVNGKTMDAQSPNWRNPKYERPKKAVVHYIFEEINPREYEVYPPNNGDGVVLAIISFWPKRLDIPDNANDISEWNIPIGLPDPYAALIIEYVIYKALIKDDMTGNASRADYHYNKFKELMGLKVQVDTATSPNAKRGAAT